MIRILRKYRYAISLILLTLAAFLVRIRGLSQDYSFWTDEDHVAIFARAILVRGRPILANGYNTSQFQSLWYWLTAFSMKLFGLNEYGARMISIIFGLATIPSVFFLTKKIFNSEIGFSASLFTSFLTIEIVWSRQARPYQAIQFFYIVELWLFLDILEKMERKEGRLGSCLLLLILIVFSSLLHWFGLLPLVFFGFYFILVRRDLLKTIIFYLSNKRKSSKLFLPFALIFTVFLVFLLKLLGFFQAIKSFIFPAFDKIGFYNHLAYYHSFLWRQYGFLTFLAIIGFLGSILKDFKKISLLFLMIMISFGLVNFRLRVPFSRYLYPVFFLIIIFAAKGMKLVSQSVISSWPKKLFPFLKKNFYIFLSMFIVFNGHKFTLKPKLYYSLNNDMQEIPEVDFKGMYQKIKEITGQDKQWVLISTWPDHATWYLGEGKPEFFLRDRSVMYGKEEDALSGAAVIGSVAELREVKAKHLRGIIVFESWETFYPEGSKEFIQRNFKKEFEVDRLYPFQLRYWPVEVYSWGG